MSTRNPLGKGLDSLLGDVRAVQQQEPMSGVAEVEIGLIEPNPDQPRTAFNEESIAALAESLKTQGIMQPLLVRRGENGSMQLIAGERRLRAAQLAGLETVPVIEREATKSDMVVMALVENLQREDLNPYDTAVAIRRLQEEHGLSQEAIAVAVGKSRAAVSNSVRLLNLQQPVQEMLRDGLLEEAAARALLALKPQSQLNAANKVVKKRLSVRQTEALVASHARTTMKKRVNPDVVRLQDELADALSAGVTITQRGKRGGGYLRIQYRNLEQLQDIIERIKN